MDFGFSEEQEMLRESARKFLEAECPTAFVRKMMEHETAHSAELWKKLAGLGWLGLLIPQRFGGMGGSLLDASVIVEEMGKALLPGPFFATVLLGAAAVGVGGSAAQKKELLPRIAEGSAVLTLAFVENRGSHDAAKIELAAKRKGRDYVLRGEKLFVFDAAVADWIVVAARTASAKKGPRHGVTLFLVERGAPGLSIAPLSTVDKTRRQANLTFDRVNVPTEQVLGRLDQGWPILSRALQVGTAALCVETVGVAQRALELSVEYARERMQFGKPIGSFQAVKHKCVDMMVAVENARSLSYYATWAVDERNRECATAVAMAKAYASDMGKNVTGDAIQVHGGIGFTWEHDIHLYYRRALANEATFGSAPLHREAVAQQLNL
jgi:alkylation response protein AidB-like acyl-CoA dehydrogenase